MIKVLLSLGDL